MAKKNKNPSHNRNKILFVSSEAQPLIKTGGLADVSGALPAALKSLQQDVRLMLPAYGDVLAKLNKPRSIAQLNIPGLPGTVDLLEDKCPRTGVKLILVKYAPAFERTGNPYVNAQGQPWPDNAERFALLARAATQVALNQAGLEWRPDIVHCNDWQTGLIPALLYSHSHIQQQPRPATVFTIHNLAYQGLFPQHVFSELALPLHLWSPGALEFHGQMSFIKGGIVFADRINTVSPRYAEEIQTAEFGYGLEGLLQHRRSVLSGIINGIDDKEWNPQTDSHIASQYSADSLANKKINKLDLQRHFQLPDDKDVLLLGFVGRLVEQKGVDLIIKAIKRCTGQALQFVFLGSGDSKLEAELKKLATDTPNQIGVHIGYSEALAHRIEAGADAFLMPSRFEPCGLNQLYSLRYGTVPIVTDVGGLSDTVVGIKQTQTTASKATGFKLTATTVDALYNAIEQASVLYSKTADWQAIVQNGMSQNFNWNASAKQYLKLYKNAAEQQTLKLSVLSM